MFWDLGFLPTNGLTGILKACGALRIHREVELVSLDLAEYHGRYLDEAEVTRTELREARETELLRSTLFLFTEGEKSDVDRPFSGLDLKPPGQRSGVSLCRIGGLPLDRRPGLLDGLAPLADSV